jgi:4-carboxymuconolactone decarboxylase
MKMYRLFCGSILLMYLGLGSGCSNDATSDETLSSADDRSAQQVQPQSKDDIHPVSGMRLPPINRDELDDYGKALYDAYVEEGRSPDEYWGPPGIRMNSPVVAEYYSKANDYLRYEAGLDPRLTELTILNAAREMDNDYEWNAHESRALKAGLSQEVVDIVKYSKPVPAHIDEEEAAIINLAREILRNHEVSSATFERALNLFGKKKLVEHVTLLGHYTATAILLETFDQQLPPGDVSSLPKLEDDL